MAQSPAVTIRRTLEGRMKPGWTILGLMALAVVNVAELDFRTIDCGRS